MDIKKQAKNNNKKITATKKNINIFEMPPKGTNKATEENRK